MSVIALHSKCMNSAILELYICTFVVMYEQNKQLILQGELKVTSTIHVKNTNNPYQSVYIYILLPLTRRCTSMFEIFSFLIIFVMKY